MLTLKRIKFPLQEGPHSVLADDEFYDAVESGLDKIEEEQEFRERLMNGQAVPVTPPATSPACKHRLWPEVGSFDRFYFTKVFYFSRIF